MNLFIVAFLYLGTAIGIIKVTMSAASAITKVLVQNILGSHTSDSSTFLGRGNDSRAKLSEAPKLNPNNEVVRQQGTTVSNNNTTIVPEQENSYMGENFNATRIRLDRNIDPSAFSTGSSSGTNIGASAVVGLVNAVGLLNQSGNVSNLGKQKITGPMQQLGGNIINDEVRGTRRFTLAQTGNTIMNKFDKPKNPSFIMHGPSQTLVNNGKNTRLNSIGGTHQINGKKIRLHEPTNSKFLLGQGVRRFYTKNVYLGNEERNGVHALPISYKAGRRIDIDRVSPKILNGKHFSEVNTSFGKGLRMEEYAKLMEFRRELMRNESLIMRSASEARTMEATIMSEVAEDTRKMLNDLEFRRMMRTVIERNPGIDPKTLASMILMAQHMVKPRKKPVAASIPLNSGTYNNNGNIAQETVAPIRTAERTIEKQGSLGETEQRGTMSEEEAKTQAIQNVRDNIGKTININTEIQRDATILLSRNILSKKEKSAIEDKVKEISSNQQLSKTQETLFSRELIDGAKDAKLTVAKTQIQEAIERNPDGVKAILGDDIFDKVVKKLKALERKQDRKNRRSEAINSKVAAARQLTNSTTEENTNSNDGKRATDGFDAVGNYLRTADINSILTNIRKASSTSDENGEIKEKE